MDGMIREFALQMLRKLQSQPVEPNARNEADVKMNGDMDQNSGDAENPPPKSPVAHDTLLEDGQDENMEDGQLPPEDLVHTPYLPERIELPAEKSHVLQHVELLHIK